MYLCFVIRSLPVLHPTCVRWHGKFIKEYSAVNKSNFTMIFSKIGKNMKVKDLSLSTNTSFTILSIKFFLSPSSFYDCFISAV